MKLRNWLFYTLLVVFLIGLFVAIFELFRYDLSTYISKDLEPAAWLEFLGSYLGFASSTLLAIAVLRQDQKINTLVANEYEPILIFHIFRFERMISNNITPSRYVEWQDNERRLLFEQFVCDPDYAVSSGSSAPPLRLFLTIENKSKLPVHNLTITTVKLDNGVYIYKKDIDQNSMHVDILYPDGIHYMCLQLNDFPFLKDTNVHTIAIHYHISIAKNTVYSKCFHLLMTGDENTVFDGQNTIS